VILGKIIKIVATVCHILRLNAPNSTSAWAPPQTPYLDLRGPTFKGRGGRGEEKEKGGEGKGEWGGRGKGGRGKGESCWLLAASWLLAYGRP